MEDKDFYAEPFDPFWAAYSFLCTIDRWTGGLEKDSMFFSLMNGSPSVAVNWISFGLDDYLVKRGDSGLVN
jgi:hypothetical protein